MQQPHMDTYLMCILQMIVIHLLDSLEVDDSFQLGFVLVYRQYHSRCNIYTRNRINK